MCNVHEKMWNRFMVNASVTAAPVVKTKKGRDKSADEVPETSVAEAA
jgi:hypothetical protein